jgi:hypothetical protein
MKAVQSFWVLPGDINAGGWINKRYEFISWSLSYALLKNNFGEVALNANLDGAAMLTDTLGLDYDEVITDLENETGLLKKAWVFGKMYAYANQNEPFVHVDGDAFWFNLPDEAFFKAGVLAQNIEMDETAYKNIWISIHKRIEKRLPCLDTPYSKLAMAANMGITGGTDNEIFKSFYQDVLEFVDDNTETFVKYREEFMFINTYLEQALFLSYLNAKNQKPAFLKKPVFRTNFEEVTDFNTLNPQTGTPDFIHLLATFKYRIQYCNLMEFWLYKIWPGQLEKIDKLCSDDPGLCKNFQLLLDPSNEKKLPVAERIFVKPEDVLSHPYLRLNELLDTNIDDQEEDKISEMINACHDPEKAADCFHFETSRQEVLKYLLQKTSQESLFSQLEKHRNFCVKPVEEIQSYKISVNPFMCLKSTHNWFNDLAYDSEYYWYKMTLSPDRVCFQELLLTETECRILDLLGKEMTIRAFIQHWCDSHQLQLNQKTVTAIHKALKEFLALDLITLATV